MRNRWLCFEGQHVRLSGHDFETRFERLQQHPLRVGLSSRNRKYYEENIFLVNHNQKLNSQNSYDFQNVQFCTVFSYKILFDFQFECCGVDNYTDWNGILSNHDLPLSCCPRKSGTVGSFYCNSFQGSSTNSTETSTVVTTAATTPASTTVTTTVTTTASSDSPTTKSKGTIQF